jgi:hypothetical protein
LECSARFDAACARAMVTLSDVFTVLSASSSIVVIPGAIFIILQLRRPVLRLGGNDPTRSVLATES